MDPGHRSPRRRTPPELPGPDHVGVARRSPPERPASPTGPVDVAELHTCFTHHEPILRTALGLGDDVEVNPSGGPLAANPMMAAGLLRLVEVANRIHSGDVSRGVAHATGGHALQHNLVAVLEGEG